MKAYRRHGLKIAAGLFDFIAKESGPQDWDRSRCVLGRACRHHPRSRAKTVSFWRSRSLRPGSMIAPRHKGKPIDINAYTAFLKEIGSLSARPPTQR